MAIPKEGYFKLEQGRYGPVFPRTPANYGFTIIAKVKPGREQAIREYGKTIEKAVAEQSRLFSRLSSCITCDGFSLNRLAARTSCIRAFSTLILTSTLEDAVAIFGSLGPHHRVRESGRLPEDWKTNAPAFVKFVRDHQWPSFLEYGEYPYVTADEVKKALRVKSALSTMLDQMQ